MGYIGQAPGLGIKRDFLFIATAAQTSFSGVDANGMTLLFDPRTVIVYVNGVRVLKGIDYNVPNVSTIVFTSGLEALDEVAIDNFEAFSPANTYDKNEADTLLAKKLSVNLPQTFTDLEKGQARANIGVAAAAGFRNKIINGGFDVWQRGLGPFTANSGFTADRWQHFLNSGGMSVSRESAIGAKWGAAGGLLSMYYAGNNTTFAPTLFQRIEDGRTLAGKKATIGVRIKDTSAASITLEVAVVRRYGTGGGASTSEFVLPYTNIGTIPSNGGIGYLKHAFDIPDVEGKTFGEGHHLEVVFRVAENKAFTLQLSTAFLVEGDATAEADPFSPRHIQQELALCQRYYYRQTFAAGKTPFGTLQAFSETGALGGRLKFPVPMRVQPTISSSSPNTWTVTNAGASAAHDVSTFGLSYVDVEGVSVSTLLAAGMVAGHATLLSTKAGAFIAADAEL